jgi:hypothetical protein
VRATEHPPGACAWHVLCSSVPSFSWRKLSPPPELAGKNCSPGDDSDEPGRAAAPPPPGAAISLPWWMLQPPPAVSQRQEQEQHWTACLQMMQCCWFASSIALELDSDRTGICDLSTEIYRSYWVARFRPSFFSIWTSGLLSFVVVFGHKCSSLRLLFDSVSVKFAAVLHACHFSCFSHPELCRPVRWFTSTDTLIDN